ncbi:MAG TPA: beta-ketoacyl synthase N-terminal-like domain-containing protein, partial [Thermoanaerobaculia bacterium]|nr:beta-ketoacyl synthase N-terminal-like domain-containing protein [Thermoanaerobaculia bacterium]
MSAAPRRSAPVAITGAGVVSPLGDRPELVFDALCRGESSLAPVTAFDPEGLPSRLAGEVRDFEPRRYLGDGNLRPLDRTGRLAAAAATLALGDAGWDAEARRGAEVGLALGTMFGSVHTISEFDRRALTAGPNYAKPMDFANSVINAAAGQTAIWHDLRGVNSTLSGGTTGGLAALAYGAGLVAAGRADAVLAGGADEVCFESFQGFARAGLTAGSAATNGGGRPGAVGSREHPVPLDADRNGFAPAEAAALLVLESPESARRRGARVLA